jgi:lysyl-tRNA synthetase class 1
MEDWLTYAPPESLSLFMYQKPRTAKRLYFDVIPKTVDEYYAFLGAYADESLEARLTNPAWHIHGGEPPESGMPVSFNLLLNLVSASNAEDKAVLWGFIRRYAPGVSPETQPDLDKLVGHAIAYFHDFVKPAKKFRAPTDQERAAIAQLYERLAELPAGASGEDIQAVVYEVGKAHQFEPLRAWFQALYEVLLGQTQGPRFGGFIQLYGVEQTRALIAKALKGELVGAASAAPPPTSKQKGQGWARRG